MGGTNGRFSFVAAGDCAEPLVAAGGAALAGCGATAGAAVGQAGALLSDASEAPFDAAASGGMPSGD